MESTGIPFFADGLDYSLMLVLAVDRTVYISIKNAVIIKIIFIVYAVLNAMPFTQTLSRYI